MQLTPTSGLKCDFKYISLQCIYIHWKLSFNNVVFYRGGGVLCNVLGGGVPLRPKNPYPISDQMVKFGPHQRLEKGVCLHKLTELGIKLPYTLIESSETSTGAVPDEECTGKKND